MANVNDQDWGEAYKELCDIIKNNASPASGVEEINHIDLWHQQTNHLFEEYPFPSHSVFIDFQAQKIETTGLNVQDIMFAITFYLVVDTAAETYQSSTTQEVALDFIRVCKKLHAKLQGLSGVNFSPLDRTDMGSDPAPEYLIVYKQTYSTIIRDASAMPVKRTAKLTSSAVRKGSRPSNNDTPLYQIDL